MSNQLTAIHNLLTKNESQRSLENVFIEDGNLIASDSKVMVVIPMEELGFTKHEIEYANGKILHKEVYRELYNAETVKFLPEGIKCTCKGGKVIKTIKYSELEGSIPQWRRLIPEANELHPLNTAVNTLYLNKVTNALLDADKGVLLYSQGENRPTIVKVEGSQQIGLFVA